MERDEGKKYGAARHWSYVLPRIDSSTGSALALRHLGNALVFRRHFSLTASFVPNSSGPGVDEGFRTVGQNENRNAN